MLPTPISVDPFTNPTSQHSTQVEPDTFSFGKTVVAAVQSGRFFDGGASDAGWATLKGRRNELDARLPARDHHLGHPAGPYARVSDPVVAYDAKHRTWLISTIAADQHPERAAAVPP